MTQLSLLPEPPPPPKATKPKPPPDPARDALWSAGLHDLASLTGLRNAAARRLLGRLCGAAKQDHAAISELVARAVELRPDDPVPWLIAGARKIGRGDDDDPWGLRAWYATTSQAAQEWLLEDYEALMVASALGAVAGAARWLRSRRGSRTDTGPTSSPS